MSEEATGDSNTKGAWFPRPWFYAWVISIIAVDQVTKTWVNREFPMEGFYREVIPGFFHLTRVHNDGIAFGMFQGNNLFMMVTVILILLIAGSWAWRQVDWAKFETNLIGGMILSGAIGNLIDRMNYGYVLDFLDFNLGFMRWPAFNVADSMITISICWIVLRTLWSEVRSYKGSQ